MSPPPLRLQRYPLLVTRSLEEASAVQSTINSPVAGELVDRRQRFKWTVNRVLIGGLGIASTRYAAGVRARVQNIDRQYGIMLPLHGGASATQPGQTASLAPGRFGALVSSEMPAAFELGTGYQGLQVMIPAARLETMLVALTGIQQSAPLRFEIALDLQRGGSADVARLLELLVGAAEREANVLHAPPVQTRLEEALLCAILLGLPHSGSALLRVPVGTSEPAYVRRAEAFIDANARRNLTTADIAAAAGIGARALFAAFRAHRGYSPREFLSRRRIELARDRLSSGVARSVAEVALECGFEHLGRFSVVYRARFGESPRETLARARRS